jgi:hypothetical protein
MLETLDEVKAAVTPRLCLCGCQKPVEARPGRGRPSVYATVECRRAVEYRTRKAARAPIAKDRREARETIHVRIADPAKLARAWFFWRYPEHYRPSGDGRNPAGFRVILSSYPGTVSQYPGCTARLIKGADVEITELARWIKGLPSVQQRDFACRAVESIGGAQGSARSRGPGEVFANGRSSHDSNSRPDPVTLGALRGFYRPGECLEAGCHDRTHGDGLCRRHYDERRNFS